MKAQPKKIANLYKLLAEGLSGTGFDIEGRHTWETDDEGELALGVGVTAELSQVIAELTQAGVKIDFETAWRWLRESTGTLRVRVWSLTDPPPPKEEP